jgi:CheY-like chemotaxis protein
LRRRLDHSGMEMRTLSVLVFDDDAGIRERWSRFRGAAGHEVVCAATGKKADIILRTRRFNLPMTDVFMPGEMVLS